MWERFSSPSCGRTRGDIDFSRPDHGPITGDSPTTRNNGKGLPFGYAVQPQRELTIGICSLTVVMPTSHHAHPNPARASRASFSCRVG